MTANRIFPFGDNTPKTIRVITDFINGPKAEGLLEETKKRLCRLQWRIVLDSGEPPHPEDLEGIAILIDKNLRDDMRHLSD